MYNYLTKDEDTYNIVLNKNPISIYTEDDLSDLDIKETYYTGFKGNTVSDRLNAVRQSSTIGLPVTTNKNKAKGALLAKGKIKFHNVLKLDIDSATPEAVQEELNKNMDSLIKIDKVLGKEIIKATNDNLQLRDDVLNDDPTKTSEKEDVIARSKSFLVRHELLKLGYDAIKTKEGYTLLRENQFLPTEINKKGFKGGGLTSTLNRRQGLYDGGNPLDNVEDHSFADEELSNQLREYNFNRLNIKDENREEAIRWLKILNGAVVLAESSNTWDATTGILDNTASGGYQMTDPQVITASDRVLNILLRNKNFRSDIKGKKDQQGNLITAATLRAMEYKKLSREEQLLYAPEWLLEASKGNTRALNLTPKRQQILFEGNMFEAKGSDKVVKPLLKGDKAAMDKFYYNFHHTRPDKKVKANWERALKNILFKQGSRQKNNKGGLVSALQRRKGLKDGGKPLDNVKESKYELNKKFLEGIHKYAIENNATGVDEKTGKTISMLTATVGDAPDSHYIVNRWNPNTRKIETDEQILKRIKPLIKNGTIRSYLTSEEAELERAKMREEILDE